MKETSITIVTSVMLMECYFNLGSICKNNSYGVVKNHKGLFDSFKKNKKQKRY